MPRRRLWATAWASRSGVPPMAVSSGSAPAAVLVAFTDAVASLAICCRPARRRITSCSAEAKVDRGMTGDIFISLSTRARLWVKASSEFGD